MALLEVKNIALTHTLPASEIARSYQSKLKATVKKADEQLRNVEPFAHVACPSATVHKSPSHMETSSLPKPDPLFMTSADHFVSNNPVYILGVDRLGRFVEATRLSQFRFPTLFEDYTERKAPEKCLLPLSDLLNEEPDQVPPLPNQLFEVYSPFYENLMGRARSVIKGDALRKNIKRRCYSPADASCSEGSMSASYPPSRESDETELGLTIAACWRSTRLPQTGRLRV
ncbi:hypothetical protein ACEPT7_09205 [Burkholderia ubonensis]|uniref:hypothetical protein n=1 Tax=Burkholderia ubonensis TaxID=101571 RepID=UPI00358F6F77